MKIFRWSCLFPIVEFWNSRLDILLQLDGFLWDSSWRLHNDLPGHLGLSAFPPYCFPWASTLTEWLFHRLKTFAALKMWVSSCCRQGCPPWLFCSAGNKMFCTFSNLTSSSSSPKPILLLPPSLPSSSLPFFSENKFVNIWTHFLRKSSLCFLFLTWKLYLNDNINLLSFLSSFSSLSSSASSSSS